MAQVGALIDFVASTKIVSADVDQNFADLRTGVNAALFVDESRNVEDNVQVRFGTAGRYWFEYNSASSAFRLRTTDSDGGGTDGTVFSVANGGVAVAFSGQVSTTRLDVINTSDEARIDLDTDTGSGVEWRIASQTSGNLVFYNVDALATIALFDTDGHFRAGANATYDLGTSGTRWRSAYLSTHLAIGSTVASAGSVRLANNTGVYWRNAANSADLRILLNSSDNFTVNTTFAPSANSAYDLGLTGTRWSTLYVDNEIVTDYVSIGSTVATDGAIRLENNTPIRWRNAANSSNITGLNLNSSDQLAVGAVLVPGVDSSYNLGASTLRWESIYGERVILGTNPSSSGLVRLPNNSGIYWRNAANSADFGLYFDTSNDFRLEADLAPSTNSAFNFGTPTFRWLGGYFDAIDATQITGTLQTASQTNITGVGTITTGVWQGTQVANAYVADLPASKITSGVLATARLGTGTASSSTWLRGDGTWQTIPGGVSQLTDLSDVSAAGVTSGNVLVANGSTYAGRALAASDIASGTFASARISEASVTQYQAALSIGATQLTGTIASARISGSYTGITAVGTLSSLTVSGALSAASLNLGSDTITDMLIQHEVGLNFGASVAAGSESTQVTVTVTGAAVGDVVYASLNANSTGLATADRIGVHARVSAANSVVVWCYNGKGTSEDMSDYDVDIILIKD